MLQDPCYDDLKNVNQTKFSSSSDASASTALLAQNFILLLDLKLDLTLSYLSRKWFYSNLDFALYTSFIFCQSKELQSHSIE